MTVFGVPTFCFFFEPLVPPQPKPFYRSARLNVPTHSNHPSALRRRVPLDHLLDSRDEIGANVLDAHVALRVCAQEKFFRWRKPGAVLWKKMNL